MSRDYSILISNLLLLEIWILCMFLSMGSVGSDLNVFGGFAQSFSSVLHPLRGVCFLYCVIFILKHLGCVEEISTSIQQMADCVGTLCDWAFSH
jgi:hypothetical protein